MFFAYLISGLATVAYLLYLYFTRTFDFWKNQNVVGPKPVPLFGNLMDSTLRRTPIMIVVRKIYDAYPNEKVVGIFRLTTPCLLIRDPDIVKLLMIKDFDLFADRGIRFDSDGLGANLFHAEEDKWRILRKSLTPVFTSGKLKNMFYLINNMGDNFIRYVDGLIQTQPEQEMCKLMMKFTFMSIMACAFGVDIDVNEENEVYNIFEKMDIEKKMFDLNFGFELDMMYPGIFSKIGGTGLLPAVVKTFFHNLVDKTILLRNGKPSGRNDFLDLVLELRQKSEIRYSKKTLNEETITLQITDNVITAQAFVIFAGGFETSAFTLAHMCMFLALNPDIQNKIVMEIKEVLERYNNELTYDALNDMVYLGRVFDETLRMFPLADNLQRVASTDYKIPETNVTLKKGQTVVVSVNGLHFDEKYWSNPKKFDPDRFSPQNSANRHPAVYIPFGIGPRNCIGMRFAKIQTQGCMVKFLQKFRVESTEHTRRNFRYDPYRIILAPLGGVKMNILPRQPQLP